MCEDNIRNFYEVVENVPLFQYERYLRFGTKNWDMSQDEFEKAVHQASEDCYDRYDNKK